MTSLYHSGNNAGGLACLTNLFEHQGLSKHPAQFILQLQCTDNTQNICKESPACTKVPYCNFEVHL